MREPTSPGPNSDTLDSYGIWRQRVDTELDGAPFEKKLVHTTFDGIPIEPLYTAEHSATAPWQENPPGSAPFARGPAFEGALAGRTRARVALYDSSTASAAESLAYEVEHGAQSVELIWHEALRGWSAFPPGPNPRGGLLVRTLGEMEQLLGAVPLGAARWCLDAGRFGEAAAALLVAVWQRRGDAAPLCGELGLDPLGTLAATGALGSRPEQAVEEAAHWAVWLARSAPQMRAFRVDLLPYSSAGASHAQQIGVALSTGLAYLRACEQAGLEPLEAAAQLSFRFDVSPAIHQELAKLRAARVAWAMVLERIGGGHATLPMHLTAATSRRHSTRYEPWLNILRSTTASFVASAAGADEFCALPFDAAAQVPDRLGRRIARNTQAIIDLEGQVGAVADPAGGSWFFDTLTLQLAEAGWQWMQRLEERGGMREVLQTGWLVPEIERAHLAQQGAITKRRDTVVGITEFAVEGERPLERPLVPSSAPEHPAEVLVRSAFSPADAVAAALSGEELGTWVGIDALGSRWVDPLTASTLAAPFEALRDQALAASERLGRPLAVYLACVGKHTSFAPRAQFARQLFAAGGFLVHESGPELELSSHAARFAESRAQVAAICGADADYAVAVLPLASALVTAGALEVYVAGKPSAAEAEQREAGVTGYFFLGQDAVSFLDKALSRAGGGA